MISYWIDSVLTLELKPSASSRVSLICTCPGLACVTTFLHSFYLWKQMDNKCEWDGKNLLALFLFYILRSWAVLHCWITLLPQNIYLVSIVWPLLYGILISNVHDDPINDSTTLTYLVSLTTNQTKQFNPFLVETATCEFTIAALHHYSCFASMTLLYLILFISLNVLLTLARLKSNS